MDYQDWIREVETYRQMYILGEIDAREYFNLVVKMAINVRVGKSVQSKEQLLPF